MNIYSKNRTSSYYYRKIYEDFHGKIPVDDDGRTFEIHHVDGDTENNSPENLIAVSIKEHYAIHMRQGDAKACLAIAARMEISPEEKRKIASQANSGEKNPSYGSKWWNDGETEIRTKIKPEGEHWVPGRSPKLSDKINKTKDTRGNRPSGNKNGRYDHRLHTFTNLVTGESVVTTQYEFRIARNMCRRRVNKLVEGSITKFGDWILSNRG